MDGELYQPGTMDRLEWWKYSFSLAKQREQIYYTWLYDEKHSSEQ